MRAFRSSAPWADRLQMDDRAQQVLVSLIDEVLSGIPSRAGVTTNAALIDLLLDLRLAVGEVCVLDELLASSPVREPRLSRIAT